MSDDKTTHTIKLGIALHASAKGKPLSLALHDEYDKRFQVDLADVIDNMTGLLEGDFVSESPAALAAAAIELRALADRVDAAVAANLAKKNGQPAAASTQD